MGVAPCLRTAAERGGEAQMWAEAPGPLPTESEVEEGPGEEGGKWQGAAAARTSQPSQAGFQASPGAGAGQLYSLGQFLLPRARKVGVQGTPPHTNPLHSSPRALLLGQDYSVQGRCLRIDSPG